MENQRTQNSTIRRKDMGTQCNTLQLNNGKATSLLGLNYNDISTNDYLSDNVLLRLLFKLLNLSPLTLILTILTLILMPMGQAYHLALYAAQLSIIFVMMAIKQLYFDRIRRKADQKVNNNRFTREGSKIYRNNVDMKDLTWGQIREGDILYLQKGQKVPADIIVLDTQHIEDREAIVYVDSRSITGDVNVQRKKACYLTQVTSRSSHKRNWQKYKQLLTGKIKYEASNSQLDKFTGYLKLIKDPMTHQFTIHNLILRESTIKTCWVYGLVVNSGMNCKIMKHIGERKKNHKFFENKLDKIFAICLVINIVLGILYSCLYIFVEKNQFQLYVIAYHFYLFSLILPHFLYLCKSVLLLYFCLFNRLQTSIMNYNSVTNLGAIDFAVLAYNGALSSGKMKVDEIITNSSIYDFKEDKYEKSQKYGSRRNGSSLSGNFNFINHSRNRHEKADLFFMNIINQQARQQGTGQFFIQQDVKLDTNRRMMVSIQPSVTPPNNLRMHLEPLRINKIKFEKNISHGEQEAIQIVTAFGLCHQAVLKGIDVKQLIFESNSKIYSEEVILKLVNKLGVHLSSNIEINSRQDEGITISYKRDNMDIKAHYDYKINNFQLQRKMFSVVCKNYQSNSNYVIYCKGAPEDILEKLKDKEIRKIMEAKINQCKDSTNQIIVYGKREMSNEEYENYQADFTKLKLSTSVSKKDLQDFSLKFERDLEFICVVGLRAEQNKEARDFIDYLTKKGIKICIFTNKKSDIKSLKALIPEQIQIEQKNDKENKQTLQYFELQGPSVEQIRYNLNSITRKIKNNNSCYSIIINHITWNLLNMHSSLMQHFLFATYYAHSILAYGLKPEQKAQLTEKLKYSYNRQHTIMCVGSSFSDLLFENHCDVSLMVSQKNDKQTDEKKDRSSQIPCDIHVNDIMALKKIIDLGSWVTFAYSTLIDGTLYRTFYISVIVLIFETSLIFSQGTSDNINSTFVFLYTFLYSLIQISFIVLVNRKIKTAEKDQIQSRDKNIKSKFLANLTEALIHGIFTGGAILLSLPNVRLSGGRILPIQALHFSFFFVLINVSIFRHFFTKNVTKKSVFLFAFTTYSIIISTILIISVANPYFYRFAIQIKYVFSSYDSAVTIINTILFCLTCSLFLSQTRKRHILSNFLRYLKIQNGIQQKSIKISQQNIQAQFLFGKDINLIQLIKHLFRHQENIQDSIQEIVAADYDVNELKINSLLQIKKNQHRIKNQFNNTKTNITRFLVTITIMFILSIIQVIYNWSQNISLISEQTSIFAVLILLLIIFVIVYKNKQSLERQYYNVAQVTFVLFCICFITYQSVLQQNSSPFILSCLLCLIYTQLVEIRIIIVIVCLSISCVISFILISISKLPNYQKVAEILFILSCAGLNLLILGSSILESRKNFILREQIEMQTNQTNDIWAILVPQFVRKLFSDNGQNNSAQFQYRESDVSILFCYVCNFDSIIQEEGKEVVKLLDDLYRQFDKICLNFAVQKIETVGYTYMAATGIRKIENQMQNQMVKRNKVQRLLNTAIQMIEKTKMFKWGVKKNKNLEIKVGIHSGSVAVGVIGKHKKQFSLIGTNVNTTSRHGSTGPNGSITLSESARKELTSYPDQSFTKKQVYMKGLCKTEESTIPVFIFKQAQGGKRKKERTNGYKKKFKELIMKIIRSQRLKLEEQNSQILFEAINTQIQDSDIKKKQQQQQRSKGRRMTCRGLQNNFNQIQEMKNREVQTKFYNIFLEFDIKKIRDYYQDEDTKMQRSCGYLNENSKFSENQINTIQQKQSKLNLDYLDYLEKNKGLKDVGIVIGLLILNISFMVINISQDSSNIAEWTVRGVNFATILSLLLLLKKTYLSSINRWILTIIFASIFLMQKINNAQNPIGPHSNSFGHFYSMMLITTFSAFGGVRFINVSILCLCCILVNSFIVIFKASFRFQFVYQFFYILFILVRKYNLQKENMINFRQGKKTAEISNQLSKIVSELLPKHAYQKLKNQNFENRFELTDLFHNCTILFADIKGFTEFSNLEQNRTQPENVVSMLKSLFQEFDVLCTKENVYKVYTIGDCYVVLGFTNCYERDPATEAVNVVSFAFKMLQTIERVKKESTKQNLSCLNMRIGIHTGTIIGGIVGTQIVRYDIYGTDVVVANKFEQKGNVGEIHISQETKKWLDQSDKKKPYSDSNVLAGDKVEVKRLNVAYNGYFIKRGSLT